MAQVVRNVMWADAPVVAADSPLAAVLEAMVDADAAVVVDDGTCHVVTHREIASAATAQAGPGSLPARVACRREAVALAPDTPVEEAIAALRERGAVRACVVEGGAPVGVVSLGDLVLGRDLDADLGPASFFFLGPCGHRDFRAPNLIGFAQLIDKVDDATWDHHLHQGDFSRWFRDVIGDELLAERTAAIETTASASVDTRAAVKQAIARRYGVR